MNTYHSRKGLRTFGLVALFALLAGSACTPNLDMLFSSATSEPPGDDAAAPAGGDEVLPPDSGVPSPTTTPSPTPIEVPPAVDGVFERAFYDPAADWGPPDHHDAFDGTNPLFFERVDGNSASWYGADERYHISYTFLDKWVWYWSDTYGIDFYVDVVVINSDECVARDSGGMLFRGLLDLDAAYMFGVTCGGSYFIGGTVLPGSGGIVCWIGNGDDIDCDPGAAANSVVPSENINAGPGAANRLGVMVEGSTLTFYINGIQVESISRPSTSLYEGYFALYLGTGQEYSAEVMFDDFSVWDIP